MKKGWENDPRVKAFWDNPGRWKGGVEKTNIPKRRLSQREARVWNYLNKGEYFYPIRLWPEHLQEMALAEHKELRERYRFFQFLTWNGLGIEKAQEWTFMNDVRNGEPVEGDYDRAAWTQMKDMKQKARDGRLFRNCAPAWDMESRI